MVNLDVPDDVILSRISDRWVHLPSGRVYNMSYNRPKVDGYDDETGEPLTKRPDDNPVRFSHHYVRYRILSSVFEPLRIQEVFARRLAKFYESTSPLIDYYASLAAPAGPPPTKLRPSYSYSMNPSASNSPSLILETIKGTTSDEIWPRLDLIVRHSFPSLKEKTEPRDVRMRHSLSDALLAGEVRASTGTDES